MKISHLLVTFGLLGGVLPAPRTACAQIEIGVQVEDIVRLGEQPETSVKLANGQYRSGKFIYASKFYVVIEPKQAVRPDAMKMYGGMPVEWAKIDTFRINSLDVEIHPDGTTGDAILSALGGLSGANGSTKEPTTLFKEKKREERKKPVKTDEPSEVGKPAPEPTPEPTPIPTPIVQESVKPAPTPVPSNTTPVETPIPLGTPPAGSPVVAAEKVFVCSHCGKDVRESQAKSGKCPHCSVSFGNVAAATGTPAATPASTAPAPQVLTIPQTELSQQPQATGFSFSNMSLGGQIGVFAGIIAVLFIVMRVM